MLGSFYLLSLALCSPNLPTADFFAIYIAMYYARDITSTSLQVMPSITEQSSFGALYTTTATKIAISVH